MITSCQKQLSEHLIWYVQSQPLHSHHVSRVLVSYVVSPMPISEVSHFNERRPAAHAAAVQYISTFIKTT